MTTKEIYALPVNGDGWRVLPSGNCVKLGDDVKLGIVCGSKHIAYASAPGVISIGCQAHTFEHWKANILKIAHKHGYTEAQGLEYQRIVAFLIADFEAGPATRFPQIANPKKVKTV